MKESKLSQVKKSLPLKLGASLIGGATLLVCVGALTLPARAAEPKCEDQNTIGQCIIDPNLAQAVADGLQGAAAGEGDTNLTVGQFRNKDGVKVNAHPATPDKAISDLAGLRTFNRIESLDLSGNPIDNYHASELAYLKDLKSLDLSGTHINNDLSQIGDKGLLESLKINSDGQHRLSDISAIGSFKRLTNLELVDQKISDVTPLKGLSELKNLNLENNKIVDVSPLASLTSLTDLNVNQNQIRDILPIVGLPGLKATPAGPSGPAHAMGLKAENQTITITPRHDYNKDLDWVLDGIRVSPANAAGVYARISGTQSTPNAAAGKVQVAGDFSKVTWFAPAKYRNVGFTFTGVVHTNIGDQLGNFTGTVTQYASVVNRLSGNVRYDTMGAIVSEAYPNETDGTVIVASGENFPDALAASGLAGKLNAPVVLTNSYSLSARADGQLARLHPSRVVVVGGASAVSDGVVDQIAKRVTAPDEPDIVRISGETRRDTANEIFLQAPKLHAKDTTDQNWTKDTAIIATGENFTDALSISALAKQESYPVFLSGQDGLDASTVKAIKNYGFTKVIIAGGSQAVPQSVIGQLENAGVDGKNITRLGGATRYQTSLQIAKYQKRNGTDTVLNRPVFATGENFPDALAGGVLAGKNKNPIVLVSPDTSVNTDALNWIKSTGLFNPDEDFAYVLGGVDAVSEQVSDEISSILSHD